MEMDGLGKHEKERIELDYMDYIREEGLFDLGDTIEMYNLEKLTPFMIGAQCQKC
jgi:hypothetical protein